MKSPWIRLAHGSDGESVFLCERCGQTYLPNFPAPLQMAIDMMHGFARMHRNCPPKEGEGKDQC